MNYGQKVQAWSHQTMTHFPTWFLVDWIYIFFFSLTYPCVKQNLSWLGCNFSMRKGLPWTVGFCPIAMQIYTIRRLREIVITCREQPVLAGNSCSYSNVAEGLLAAALTSFLLVFLSISEERPVLHLRHCCAIFNGWPTSLCYIIVDSNAPGILLHLYPDRYLFNNEIPIMLWKFIVNHGVRSWRQLRRKSIRTSLTLFDGRCLLLSCVWIKLVDSEHRLLPNHKRGEGMCPSLNLWALLLLCSVSTSYLEITYKLSDSIPLPITYLHLP